MLNRRVNMCMSNNIESYCYKKKMEQSKYKRILTAGNDPTITSRNIFSQAQLSRSSVASVIPVSITYLNDYYYDKMDTDEKFLTQTVAYQYYLLREDASYTYINKTDASNIYLSRIDASNTYLSQLDASNTYLSRIDASNGYLSLLDASATYLKQTNASNTYTTIITTTGIQSNVSNIQYFTNNNTTFFSGNVRIGRYPPNEDNIQINGNVLIGNPTVSESSTKQIRLGDVSQINGSCTDIYLTPKIGGNVNLGGSDPNSGCNINVYNGNGNIVIGGGPPGNGNVYIGGDTSLHTGNIDIATSLVSNNKINIGSNNTPVRIKNQFVNASPNIINESYSMSLPCYSYYSVDTAYSLVITLPQVSSANIGLKITFVRVSGASDIYFEGYGSQIIYNKLLVSNGGTEIKLMDNTTNTVTVIYLKIDNINYAWFQI